MSERSDPTPACAGASFLACDPSRARLAFAWLFILLTWPLAPQAATLDAWLVAEEPCPATISIKRGDNPDGVFLVPGERYRVVGANRAAPTHYRLRFEETDPKERWIGIECGRLLGTGEAEQGEEGDPGVPPLLQSNARPSEPETDRGSRRTSMAEQYVLAASWQPAFCEQRPTRPECRDQTQERVDARHFSLHGLWPQPISNSYCGVTQREREGSMAGDWRRLPALSLESGLRARLDAAMPGTRSYLHRHQWVKHGSCYGDDPEVYFRDALDLLDQLNASGVRTLFDTHIGQRLRASQIQAAFDTAFGRGAGERVRLKCSQGLIEELRIGLKGPIEPGADLGRLILAAPKRSTDCRGGWVDAAGIEGPR